MGFFDKKKRDDEDEEDGKSEVLPPIAPKAPPPPPPSPSVSSTAATGDFPKAEAAKESKEPAPVPKSTPPPPAPPPDPTFGIDDAVALMRQLPNRNMDLVMQVVKKTLESVHVDVARIIDGATKKEHVIDDRITTLKKEIEQLEAKISTMKKEIAGLESDQKEVTAVKERLVLAQKTEHEGTSERPAPAAPVKSSPPPVPSAVSTPPAPKS